MKKISDLSSDLVEEILSRVPLTSLGAVRSTCKPWRTLSKDQNFTKKHYGRAAKGQVTIMTCDKANDRNTQPTRFNLFGIDNIKDLSSAKKLGTTLCSSICEVYQCDGLLLCVTTSNWLVVWNPYWAQIKWIKVEPSRGSSGYVMGYDDNNNYKVLRSFLCSYQPVRPEIYDFKSNLWRTATGIDILDNSSLTDNFHGSVSLMGNTYFVDKKERALLTCFDFTIERFRPPLPLPFDSDHFDNMVLSCVGDEQLAVLHKTYGVKYELEIWITTKLEFDAVSWSKFFKLSMETFLGFDLMSTFQVLRFFIDKEKKLAMVCGGDLWAAGGSTSYVVGEDGYYNVPLDLKGDVLISYVPTSVCI